MMLTLGIDVACRADHVASLADATGAYLWQGRRFRSQRRELDALMVTVPAGEELTVVLEPTRNAWVPLAAYFRQRGARVVLVPPEQSADLRRYYSKHTKNDKLDSKLLARLPLLHPDGLTDADGLGPADALKRAVRRRAALVDERTAVCQRIDSLLELLSPSYADAFGTGDYTKTALMVLARYPDPRALRRLGLTRLTQLCRKVSRGHWGEDRAKRMLAAATDTLFLWEGNPTLDFAELGKDIAAEVRRVQALDQHLTELEDRIERLYQTADPAGIVVSAPGVATTLAAGILARLGDAKRFANLGGVRSFSGMVPTTDQSGTGQGRPRLTKAGDPGLRRDLYLAAEQARQVDPQLASKYYTLVVHRGLHHTSATCHLATTLLTRIAACWRRGEPYQLHDLDGRHITQEEGRRIVAQRYTIPDHIRRARRRLRQAQTDKNRTSRSRKESTEAAPATGSPTTEPTHTQRSA